jgi:nucleotide-binding universal stress UspA family protein
VDLSEASPAILDLVLRVAAPTERVLDLVHVYETAHEQMLRRVATSAGRAAYHRECRSDARRAVGTLIAASAAAPMVRMVALRRTDPRLAILGVARRRRADLIAVGTHGRTGLGRWLLGSVAEAVMRHASCDVLVAPCRRSTTPSGRRAA